MISSVTEHASQSSDSESNREETDSESCPLFFGLILSEESRGFSSVHKNRAASPTRPLCFMSRMLSRNSSRRLQRRETSCCMLVKNIYAFKDNHQFPPPVTVYDARCPPPVSVSEYCLSRHTPSVTQGHLSANSHPVSDGPSRGGCPGRPTGMPPSRVGMARIRALV